MGVFGGTDFDAFAKPYGPDGISWPWLRNASATSILSEDWGVARYPANFLVDGDGVVQAVNVFDPDQMKDAVKQLISQKRELNEKRELNGNR